MNQYVSYSSMHNIDYLEERNNWTFNGVELSTIQLKSLF